jgi:hypothetical protein
VHEFCQTIKGFRETTRMEVFTPKTARRSTRVRVEIPLTLTCMDRRNPLTAQCVALVVSPQGCGVRSSQPLPMETPVLLGNLPGGATATGYVANCLPLGNDGKYFLIGISLYNHGNIWGIADPPGDWDCPAPSNEDESKPSKSSGAKKNKAAGHI